MPRTRARERALLAWRGVDDFEGVARDDDRAVTDHDDGFLGTGAEHRVPGATAKRAWDIHHQASPPLYFRR